MPRRSLLPLLLALPLLAACGSTPTVAHADFRLPTLAQSEDEALTVEAFYYQNHERVLGDDVLDEEKIVPLWVRVGARERCSGGDTRSFSVSLEDCRLYLPDGTALAPFPFADLSQTDLGSSVKRRMALQQLEPTVGLWDGAERRLMLFALEPKERYSVLRPDMVEDKQASEGDDGRRAVFDSMLRIVVRTDARESKQSLLVGIEPTYSERED